MTETRFARLRVKRLDKRQFFKCLVWMTKRVKETELGSIHMRGERRTEVSPQPGRLASFNWIVKPALPWRRHQPEGSRQEGCQ